MTIEAENISKCYKISSRQDSFRDLFSKSIRSVLGRLKGQKTPKDTSEEFWALKDVSFKLGQGKRLGIVGSNGAGKSTLLKILSRVTLPSSGSIRVKGRLASLLEVGTGFHPDLTGRENVFLNGSILGMKRREILTKMNQIIEFSEIAPFIDMPVKRYSSGMYMRLAFSVAAHVDPDILIIDEALSVGDIRFQEKCIKKMSELGDNGRTLLFVSHSTPALLALCDSGIFLKQGQMILEGGIEECVDLYMKEAKSRGSSWSGCIEKEGIRLLNVHLVHPLDAPYFQRGEQAYLRVTFEVDEPRDSSFFIVQATNSRHQMVAITRFDAHHEGIDALRRKGTHEIELKIDTERFFEGSYTLSFAAGGYSELLQNFDPAAVELIVFPKSDAKKLVHPIKDMMSLGEAWKPLFQESPKLLLEKETAGRI